MSVALFNRKRINSLDNKLATNDTESRAIWYGYVANLTAYNLQYRENIPIDYDTEELQTEKGDYYYIKDEKDAYDTLCSLLYNIYTNDGNCFLEDRWVKVLTDIKDRLAPKYDKMNVRDLPTGGTYRQNYIY